MIDDFVSLFCNPALQQTTEPHAIILNTTLISHQPKPREVPQSAWVTKASYVALMVGDFVNINYHFPD